MIVKALRSFSGVLPMRKGDIREIKDETIARDLLKVGYVEKIELDKPDKSIRRKKEADNADNSNI